MDKIKIPESEWVTFHIRRGRGDFAHMRYGQAFYNYFNLADKHGNNDQDMDKLYYGTADGAYEVISRRIEITTDEEEK